MKKILTIIKKNLKVLLFRSRVSATVIILGPLVLMLLVGVAFNTSNIFDIRVGTYSDTYSTLSNSVIDGLKEQQFKIVDISSKQSCIDSVKTGDIHICAVFPPNLDVQTEGDIEFFVDQSRINLIYAVLDAVNEKVSFKSEELSTQLTQVLVDNLDNTQRALTDKGGKIENVIKLNTDSKDKLTKAKGDLEDINLWYNLTDVDLLQNYSENINASDSASKTQLSKLKTSLKTLEKQITDLTEKIKVANATILAAKATVGTARDGIGTSNADLTLVKKDLDGVLTGIQSIQVKNVGNIVSPIKTKIEPIVTDARHLNTLFPALIVLVVMFISLLLSATVVMKEKLSKAYFRNFITPTSGFTFVVGTFLSIIIVLVIQLVILLGVLSAFFELDVVIKLWESSFTLLIIGSVFIFLGMLIGYLFNSEETSSLASIALGSIFLVFSNTILPIESIPSTFRQVIVFSPFVMAEALLKKLLIFNATFSSVATDIYMLLIYAIVLFALVLIVQKLTQRNVLLQRFIDKFKRKRAGI